MRTSFAKNPVASISLRNNERETNNVKESGEIFSISFSCDLPNDAPLAELWEKWQEPPEYT